MTTAGSEAGMMSASVETTGDGDAEGEAASTWSVPPACGGRAKRGSEGP